MVTGKEMGFEDYCKAILWLHFDTSNYFPELFRVELYKSMLNYSIIKHSLLQYLQILKLFSFSTPQFFMTQRVFTKAKKKTKRCPTVNEHAILHYCNESMRKNL